MGLKLISATAIFLSLACVQNAIAEGGCGPGFHRGPYGHCRPNGPVVVAPGAPVVVAPAPELLAPIYGWFTEGFDTRDLKEAKALLDAS